MFVPIAGYEGLYEISHSGIVMSLQKKAGRSLRKVKIVATFPKKTGYIAVNLWKDNKSKQHFLHRILADAFISNPNNYPIVNHKDGNKTNNDIENLEWCTAQANVKHAYDNGLKVGKGKVK